MSAIKKSISIDDQLWARMLERKAALGYSTPSAYIQQLVRDDLLRQGAHIRGVEMPLQDRGHSNSPKVDAAREIAFAGIQNAAVLRLLKKEAKP
jgi:hypothetical protein